MVKNIILLLLLSCFSCSEESQYKNCTLTKTEKKLSFALDSNTQNELRVYSIYKDKN